ncbi:hypothetical protein PTKIN_Ptkin03bG0233300 [Pterospermum kingtungense]
MSALITSWLTPSSLFILLNIMIGVIFLISRLSHHPKTPHPQRLAYDGGYSSAPPLQRAPSLIDRVKSINFSTYKFPFSNPDFDHHLQPDDSLAAHHPLERAPSILERVKSINFSLYKYSPQNPDTDYVQPTEQEHTNTNPQPLSRASSLLERVKSIDFTSFYRSDSVKSNQQTEPHDDAEKADSDTDTSTTPVLHGKVKRIQSEPKVRQRKQQPEKMKKSASENSRNKVEEDEQEEEEVERSRPATTRIEKTVSFGDGGDQGVDAKADDFINKFRQQLKLQRLDSLLRYKDMLKGK